MNERFIGVFWEALKAAKKRQRESLVFSSIDETRSISVSSISHFVINDHIVKVYYNNEVFDFTSTMTKICELLHSNENFVRIHRSTLINIAYIASFGRKMVVMRNSDRFVVSRNYIGDLKAAIKRWPYLHSEIVFLAWHRKRKSEM